MSIKLMRDMLNGDISNYVPKKTIYHNDQDLWNFYLKMSSPLNLTKKTLDTFLGLLFGGGVTSSDDIITANGLKSRDFIENMAKEILSVGYVGIYLDIDNKFILYSAENIVSFKTNLSGKITRVVLQESYDSTPDDDYETIALRNRYLRLKDGKFFIQVDKSEEIEVRFKGKSLDFIPFLIISYKNLNEIVPPPLLDLAKLNIDHYILDLMFKNGLNVVSMPTPIITASSNILNNEPLKIGYHSVLNLPEGATATFMELNGNSLMILQNAIKDLESKMLLIGTKMLEPNKNVGESAEAIRLNQVTEIGILNGIADSLMDGFNLLAEYYSKFFEKLEPITINKNFLQQKVGVEILALGIQLVQNGVLKKESILKELQKNSIFIDKFEDLELYLNDIITWDSMEVKN